MKYKKIAIILAAILALGTLTACGGDKKEQVEKEKEELENGIIKEDEKAKEESEKIKEEENNLPETELTVEKDTASEFEEWEEVKSAIVQLETIKEK